ncbi:hypothetical protein GJ744_012245 [Endocarpon pusillum]|uniref:Uncharacterized protein n=1 Tax=Endocarpon pusillum TaxID=364733 RepID=A0A8H7E0H9_9EURO|nr:hypothetical protein GJ744_012245 [Endocarpon pusillum]
MATELGRLCKACQDLRFDHGTLKRCAAANCVDGVISGEHTSRVSLQPDLGALEYAAKKGCHLCSLISSGLQQHKEKSGHAAHSDESKSPGEISLVYFLSIEMGRENIIAHHDERWVTLHLTEKPSTSCGDHGFASKRGLDIGPPLFMVVPRRDSLYIKSYDRSHGHSEHPLDLELSGLTYNAGQLLGVSRENSGYFLVSPVAKGDETLRTGRQNIGWIKADACLKLTRTPHPLCPCGTGLWEPPLLAKGETAYLETDPLSPTLVGRIKSWIETCDSVHPFCRQPIQNKSVLPYRVVDVGPEDGSRDAFLSVGNNRSGEYATLSYRWGTTPTLTSTTKDVRDRQCKI